MARQIRDRDTLPLFGEVEQAGTYYIEAKLKAWHAGVGSWGIQEAKSESDARTKYLKANPGRVIVKCEFRPKVKKRVVRER